MLKPEISVIVPCYKEADVIQTTLFSLSQYLKQHFERFEIIVVIDGSPDATEEKVREFGNAHPEIPLVLICLKRNHGKGFAVKQGVLASKYESVLFIDADLTIPIEEASTFCSALDASDIVIASRLVSGSKFEEPAKWYRTLLARSFYILQILILGNFEFSDTQCGFKLFRRTAALKIFPLLTVSRFAFDAEILFLARKDNMRVSVLPVHIKKDLRATNVKPLQDSLNMFFSLLKIRLNDFSGKYDTLNT